MKMFFFSFKLQQKVDGNASFKTPSYLFEQDVFYFI